ncbi:MAG: bifunctional oligoribonuclease/PAP phosphatase NrnA [Clostridia bacterium]|nr:bifunctional oligoribonuclease/PAP phosphatase NrnA [Clostridia bacterium]
MFKKAKEMIEKANKIYVVGHINPDGDAIGSSFAVYFALKNMGKDVNVIMPKYSESFAFLPGIANAVESVEEECYDLLIAVDSSVKTRLAISEKDYNKAKQVIMLDHHKTSEPFGDFQYINSEIPAASQIIYDFLTEIGCEIDKTIATYLYAGIVTDTGSFNYSSTKPSTLLIAAKLLELNIDFSEICKKLNDTIKEAKLRLIALTIDNMEVYFDGKFRYSYVSYEDIKRLGLDEEDAEGMTNYLRMVEGTEIAVAVRGKSNGTNKVSMRSNGKVDVSKIAISFDGGGHARAAGYTMPKDLETSKKELLDAVGVMLK